MRIAVAGATGRIGKLTTAVLETQGHEVVRMSRSLGIDLVSGEGLDTALVGVEAVIDVMNTFAPHRAESISAFGTATTRLLAAEQRVGVAHHVLLSILGLTRVEGNAHYAGKREQERLVRENQVPWTILAASQFYDFAEMVMSWTEREGVAEIPPLLLQPVAPGDVAATLAGIAAEQPLNRHLKLAGPEPHDLVDMARRINQVRGRDVRLVPTWSSIFGLEMAGNVLLADQDAQVAPTTFETWLAQHEAGEQG